MRVCNVVGARPNFMKMAPVVRELARLGIDQKLVHTGQHYDPSMSDVFFQELELPPPDVHLGVGSDSHSRQTAAILVAFDAICQQWQPDLVIVSGDVNSTLAAALVAAKRGIAIAHVEAGLRSLDRTMPEEINRIVVDHLSTFLFASEPSGVSHLLREGIAPEQIHLVGNCMVDSLLRHVESALVSAPWEPLGLKPEGYALLTLHRPSNVDVDAPLRRLLHAANQVAKRLPVLFSVHPRTRNRLEQSAGALGPGLKLTGPLPYTQFLGLMARAAAVLTDSGGIQEETTALGVPCLALRENTERPITVTEGTNRLVGNDTDTIVAAIDEVLAGNWPRGRRPQLWDGRAAVRIVQTLDDRLFRR